MKKYAIFKALLIVATLFLFVTVKSQVVPLSGLIVRDSILLKTLDLNTDTSDCVPLVYNTTSEKVEKTQWITGLFGGAKFYFATITQGGVNPPSVTVKYNTIGTIVWTYSSNGVYIGTLAGAFSFTKTWCIAGTSDIIDTNDYITHIEYLSDDTVVIRAIKNGTLSDDSLSDSPILIIVFP